MQHTAIFCDKCNTKRTFETNDVSQRDAKPWILEWTRFTVIVAGPTGSGQMLQLDLCPKCAIETYKFVTGKDVPDTSAQRVIHA